MSNLGKAGTQLSGRQGGSSGSGILFDIEGFFSGAGLPIPVGGLGFPDANSYGILVMYENPTTNPGTLSIEYVDGDNAKIHSSNATDASHIRGVAFSIPISI